MNIFKKASTEFTMNDTKIKISPLGLPLIFRLKSLKEPMARAVANLFNPAGINDFEKVTHSTPKPTDSDGEAIELIDKTTTKAPSPTAITQAITSKQQGVEAIFDCLLQDGLLADILIDSVDVLKDKTPENVMVGIDIPSAVELFGHIVEVNIGGFDRLGKSWSHLKKFMGQAGDKA